MSVIVKQIKLPLKRICYCLKQIRYHFVKYSSAITMLDYLYRIMNLQYQYQFYYFLFRLC